MFRGPSAPVVFLGLATLGAVVALVGPNGFRSARRDFRDGPAGTADEARRLEAERENALRHAAVGDQIAESLSDDRIAFADAVEAVATLADCAPDWFARLRERYRATGKVSPTATDRDVMAEYLLVRVESMALAAGQLGHAERAAALSARLDRLREEARSGLFASAGKRLPSD